MDTLIVIFSVALWLSAVVVCGLSISKGLAGHAKKVATKRVDQDHYEEGRLLRELPDDDVAWLADNGWIRAKSEKLTRESDY